MPLVFVIVVLILIIIVCLTGIILSIKFQHKQSKKYKECLNIINEKKDLTFNVKTHMNDEEINNIDPNINVPELQQELYDKYLEFLNKISEFSLELDDVLTGSIKDIYIDKLKRYKEKNCNEVTKDVELVGYCITEFSEKKLKFRITIDCFNYKIVNDKIVSGSNAEKVEQILLVTYKKSDEKWLIENIQKIFEKKLSN